MAVTSGSQVVLCCLPIRFDTYSGCSHGCKYCFARKKQDLEKIEATGTAQNIRDWVDGKRTTTTNWCDWNIPLHWGGLSDPFQPAEKIKRRSLECLKVFAETKYPFVVSTKGRLVAEPEYLDLIQKCNCVVQISMVCSKYDVLEPGCPSYKERMEILRKVSAVAKRTIVRIQPYMPEVYKDVLGNIPLIKEAGAYGIIVEGMKFARGKPGMVKVGGDCCYPISVLRPQFENIKAEAHAQGLRFFVGENRLRAMGDDMCCCGIENLEGFKGNDYNLCTIINGKAAEPSPAQKKIGTAKCFNCIHQTTEAGIKLERQSFCTAMKNEYENAKEYYKRFFGIKA